MNCQRREALQEALEKNPACYLLITCGEPSEDGHIPVEMSYEGDLTLLSYLLRGAQHRIDQEESLEMDFS